MFWIKENLCYVLRVEILFFLSTKKKVEILYAEYLNSLPEVATVLVLLLKSNLKHNKSEKTYAEQSK